MIFQLFHAPYLLWFVSCECHCNQEPRSLEWKSHTSGMVWLWCLNKEKMEHIHQGITWFFLFLQTTFWWFIFSSYLLFPPHLLYALFCYVHFYCFAWCSYFSFWSISLKDILTLVYFVASSRLNIQYAFMF